MELSKRDRSFSPRPLYDDIGVQGRKCHSHVRGIGGDAVVGPTEDGVKAIDAVERRAAGTRSPFVAREIILVAEIGTTRTLHDVAAH